MTNLWLVIVTATDWLLSRDAEWLCWLLVIVCGLYLFGRLAVSLVWGL